MNAEQIKEELDKINNSIRSSQKKEKETRVKNEIDKIKELFLSQKPPVGYQIYHAVDVNVCPSLLKRELNKLGFFVDGIELKAGYNNICDFNIIGYDFLTEKSICFNKWLDKDILNRRRLYEIIFNIFEKGCGIRTYYGSGLDDVRLIDLLIQIEYNLLRESFLYKFNKNRFKEMVISIEDNFYETTPIFVGVCRKNRIGKFKLKGKGCKDFPFEMDLTNTKTYKDFMKRKINLDQFLSHLEEIYNIEIFKDKIKYLIKIYIPNVPLLTLEEYKLKLEEFRIEVYKIYRINIPQENESNKKGFWSKIFK